VFALCEALNGRIDADEDGYVLLEVYWLALAGRLHELLGIPVPVPEIDMPIEEQLRRGRLALRGDGSRRLRYACCRNALARPIRR
jgi:hypothetical protein